MSTTKTVEFSASFQVHAGLWRNIRWVNELAPGDDPETETITLKDKVESLMQKFNVSPTVPISDALHGVLPEVQVDKPMVNRIALLIEDIENETVLRKEDGTGGLLAWKLVVESNPELKPAFDKRLKELS